MAVFTFARIMSMRKTENQCVEFGNKTPNRNLICDRCRPLYGEKEDSGCRN